MISPLSSEVQPSRSPYRIFIGQHQPRPHGHQSKERKPLPPSGVKHLSRKMHVQVQGFSDAGDNQKQLVPEPFVRGKCGPGNPLQPGAHLRPLPFCF